MWLIAAAGTAGLPRLPALLLRALGVPNRQGRLGGLPACFDCPRGRGVLAQGSSAFCLSAQLSVPLSAPRSGDTLWVSACIQSLCILEMPVSVRPSLASCPEWCCHWKDGNPCFQLRLGNGMSCVSHAVLKEVRLARCLALTSNVFPTESLICLIFQL